MKTLQYFLVLGLLVTSASLALADDQKALNTEFRELFVNKVVTLRNFDTHPWQQYKEDGQMEGKPAVGPWTLYSKLRVLHVNIDHDRISLSGTRIFVGFDDKQGELQLLGSSEPLKVDVRISKPVTSESTKSALAKVLVHSGESMAPLVPEYWRHYFEPEVHPVAGNPKDAGGPTKEEEEKAAATAKNPPPKIVRILPGVAQGNLIKQVRPSYPQFAKSFRQMGTVILSATIDTTGSITNLQVARPAGFGLDEAAVEAVQQWKYKPYTLNGIPTAVETTITVNFRMGP